MTHDPLTTTKRTDNPDVPNKPHHVRACSLDVETGEYLEVTYLTEDGEERQIRGEVTNSAYEKLQGEDGTEYTLVLYPSDDHNAPIISAEGTGYIGWVTSIKTIYYDEAADVTPSYDPDILRVIGGLTGGETVSFTADQGRGTGVVHSTSSDPAESAVLLKSPESGDETQFTFEYQSNGVTARLGEYDAEDNSYEWLPLGTVDDVMVEE